MKPKKSWRIVTEVGRCAPAGRIAEWLPAANAARDSGRSLDQLTQEMAGLREKIARLESEAAVRRETAAALGDSENKFRFLVDHSKEIILVLDKKGTIVFVNKNTISTYGYKENELVGKPMTDFMEHESAGEALAALTQDISGRRHTEYDVRARSKSGEIRYLRIAGGSTPVHEGERLIGVMITASDVTEQRRADEILRESEKKFRSFAEQSPNMIFLNIRGRIVYVNKMCCEIMGYTKKEFGSPKFDFLSLIAPESRDAVKESLQKHLKRKQVPPEECLLLTKEGKRIEAILNTRLIDYGKERAILGTVTDVSEYKRVVEEKRNSEEMFRLIFENARDAYYLIDFDGKLVDANRMAAIMMGYEPRELIGRSVFAVGLLAADQIPLAVANLARNLEGVSTGPVVYDMRRKDGGRIQVELSSHPIKLRGRTLVLGIARDITEQRRGEESLRKSETKYRALFECANDAVFLMDLKENTKMVNQKAADMLGYGIPELLGKSFKDIVGASAYQDALSRIMKVMGEEPIPLHERFFRKKDGTEFPVEINISLLRDENGKPLYIQRIVRDISTRQKFLNELEQSSRKLRLTLEGVIKAVAATVEQRDPYTAGHQKRVADLARAIATEMSLSADQIEAVYMAGVIHDIGKISVPAEILSKPGTLSSAEFSLIKMHAKIGYDILKDIDFPWPITQIIYQHHERLDGSGYPRQLHGDDIMIEARILAVADVVEASCRTGPIARLRDLKRPLSRSRTGSVSTRPSPPPASGCSWRRATGYRYFLISLRSFWRLNGLERKEATSYFAAIFSSASEISVERKMMGIFLVLASFLKRPATSPPSISGSMMSRMMRLGARSLANWMAAAPLTAMIGV